LGKRLRPLINDKPKVLADIGNKAFLDILIEYLASFGFRRFILCTGYKSEAIEEHFSERYLKLDIIVYPDKTKQLLGTGGAVKGIKHLIKNDVFLVSNGDSFCPLNIEKFYKFHIDKKAYVSIALVNSSQDSDVGFVSIDDKQKIISFNEKLRSFQAGYVNAGLYLFNRQIFLSMPDKLAFSLEYDFFPHIAGKEIYGYFSDKNLIDIGTPKRYRQAVNAKEFSS
jgi:NDP-sugar pyrophosphorylase family protein